MTYSVRTVTCTGCGAAMTGKYKPHGPYQCLECAIRKTAEANRQLARHEGPVYERWLASMVKVGQRAARKANGQQG